MSSHALDLRLGREINKYNQQGGATIQRGRVATLLTEQYLVVSVAGARGMFQPYPTSYV